MKKLMAIALGAVALFTSVLVAAPPADPRAEKEVMAVMEVWRQAMVTKDRAVFDKIYHADLRYGHSNGRVENKAEAIEYVLTSKSSNTAVDLADTKVNFAGNLALVNGRVHLRQMTDGKPSDIHLFVLHVLVKGPQGWQMIGRQATREGS